MIFSLFRRLQEPQDFGGRRFAQQQVAMDVAGRFFANDAQHLDAMQVAGIAFRAVLANHKNLACQKCASKEQVIFAFVVLLVMDKRAVDIAAAYDNNGAFIALERTQNTFELVLCAKHKHVSAHIDMLFPFALDDKIIPDVRLNCSSDASHGIVVVPKVGSAVLVTSIADDDNFVAQFSEIDKITIVANTEIVINGGSLGGLIKIEELKNNLKSLKDYCEALKSAIATGLTSVGASTAASGEAGAQAFNGEMIGKTISFSDMEDKNVKH